MVAHLPPAEAASKRADALQLRLDRAVDGWTSGELDYAVMKRIKDTLVPQIAQAERESDKHLDEPGVEAATKLTREDGRAQWDAMSVTLKRTVLDTLQVTVVINKSSRRGPSTCPFRLQHHRRLPGREADRTSAELGQFVSGRRVD